MDDLLQQGIAAHKAGKRDEARKIFITAVKQNPDNERAWGGMYEVSGNEKERVYCLKQILRINPNHEKAKQMLGSLTGQDFPFDPPQPAISAKPSDEGNKHFQAKCFFCAELIPSDAVVCPYCRRKLPYRATPTNSPKIPVEQNEQSVSNLEWHYSTNGYRFGPVPEDQIIELIKQKKITEQSLVWNKSIPEWQFVLTSKFADLVRDPIAPPPLTGAAVSDTIIWVLAFAPLIGVFLEGVVSR